MIRLEGVTRTFGGLVALDNVSLAAARGSITGLIGPNGAGKTTLFNCATRFLPVSAGRIWYEGQDITCLPPHRVAKMGMLRTFQTPTGFPRLSVVENLLVVPFDQPGERTWDSLVRTTRMREHEARHLQQALQWLDAVGLADRAGDPVADLSAGQLKLLELIRPVMANPRLLLLDEPASGVNPSLLDKLVAVIRMLRDQGITFVIIDHNLGFVMSICDHIHVLAAGQLVASGPPEEISRNEKVIQIYLGDAA